MRTWLAMAVVAGLVSSACSGGAEPAPANTTPAAPAAPALTPIPRAADQPVSGRERTTSTAHIDLDAILDRGYIRILVAPSRTYFETANGHHHGRAVDAGVALADALGRAHHRELAAVFIETREDQLVPALLAGKGDVAANVMLTFARDDQVAFAPPIVTGIREIVVTASDRPMISLEDVGGRAIHVRKDSDHHASLLRLNDQLEKINRPIARIVADPAVKTDEALLQQVNSGRIPATIADDYIFDLWKKEFPRITANRDIAVSQDGILAWVARKDAPALAAGLKQFFGTHRLTF